ITITRNDRIKAWATGSSLRRPRHSDRAKSGVVSGWVACSGSITVRPRNPSADFSHTTPWLKTTLVQTPLATPRKTSYFHAQFLRLKSRRGPKKAILAVAASMLTDVYQMLLNGVEFHDLGGQHFVQHDRDKERLTKQLLRRLRELGVDVDVKGKAA